MIRNITTGSVQNMDFSIDPGTGNLISRKDNLNNLTEIFTCDDIYRLTEVSGPGPLSMSYSSTGNLLTKTSVGTYSYDGSKPHAVTSVTNPDGLISTTTQRITCTSFNKADSIIQGNLLYTISNGHEDQRTISKFYDNGNLQKTVYYAGEYEKEILPGNTIRQHHYIPGGDGLAAIFVRNNNQDTMYYIHTDHLGSINVITNQSGAVVKNYSFDGWGRRHNPFDWTYNNIPTTFLLDRGFTGHEHLDKFALINMNGRVYDPILARMLSPDNYLQLPDFTQSFNRYSYCLNNPLVYTDPSGEKWKWWQWLIGDFLTGGLISSTATITATQLTVDLLTYHATATLTVQSIKSVVVPLDYTVQFCNTLFSNNYYAANSRFQNAIKIDFGLFQTDPNISGGDQAWQLISRFTWEHLQTELGRTYTHARNMVGDVDRVDYFGGATFATKEYATDKYGDPISSGISIGNYININISDEIAVDFESYVISNPLYMHEYGHTFDSRRYGMTYLFAIGLPSLISAMNAEQVTGEPTSVTTHDFRVYEMRANKYAADYFGKYYGVDWLTLYKSGTIETYYPRTKR